MRIVGIKVGSRSALTAKRDGTVIWTPPIDVDPHTFTWQPVPQGQTPQAINRVQLDPAEESELRSSTTEIAGTLLSTRTGTAWRGTVRAGPVWDNVNRNWWYQVDWDDALLGSSDSWTHATNLQDAVENRAPVAAAQSLTATVGTPLSITLSATDADGDAITYTVLTQPNPLFGTLTGTAPNLSYMPTGAGSDGFSFLASDGVLNSESAWIGIVNSPVVAPPVTQLVNGVGVVLSGADDSRQFFTIDANSQIYNLVVTLAGSNVDNGDTDLYIRFGEQPVPYNAQSPWGGVFNFVSEATGNNESITIATPAIGTHHVLVHGWYENGAFTDVTLRATWSLTPPTPPTPPTGPIEGTQSLTSITQHGITWSFDKAYECGNYCNGDWFVIGPVVITAISPTPTTGRNGTVVNPERGREQGFDDRIYSNFYDASQNVGTSMPLSVAVNSSVVSSISKPARTNNTSIETFAVLTVVSAAPTAGSFRPCYIGSGSRASLFNANQIDYNRLQKLSPPASTPDINVAAAQFERTWYEQDLTWSGWYFHTEYMSFNGYGRDLAVRTGNAGLLLHLNYSDAQKKNLLIRYIQYGIDIYGILVNGGRWGADGGHNNGRLSPLLTAAAVLNDSRILARVPRGAPNFQEYEQTFRVEQSDVGTKGFWQDLDKDGVYEFFGGINGTPVVQYTNTDVGMDEWGAAHVTNPEKDNNRWGTLYRDIAGGTLTCATMTARALGLRTLCAWEPLFLYAIRHINYEQGNGPIPYGGEFDSNPTPAFHKAFYNAYHTQYP